MAGALTYKLEKMKKNSFLLGVLTGIIFPVLAHILTIKTDWETFFQGKTLSLYVLAAVCNLFIIRLFYKKQQDKSGMGAVAITFAGLLYLLIVQKIKI